MKRIKAVTVEQAIRNGSSRPLVILSDNGLRYLVKLSGSGASHNSAIIEVIAVCMAKRFFMLPVLDPVIAVIDESLVNAVPDSEIDDSLGKSRGDNLAYFYYENAGEPAPAAFAGSNKMFEQIFLYDLFVQNIDRTGHNVNLLEIDGRIFSIDYESSFLIKGILEGKNYDENLQVLKQLRASPLYRDDADLGLFLEKCSGVSKEDIRSLVHDIAESMIAGVDKEDFIEKLHRYFADGTYLHELYERVKNMPQPDVDEQANERMKRRKEFQDKLARERK